MEPENCRSIDTLLEIMARLRDPKEGCPWDREQTFGTIAPYTIEEAYEVADAIDRDNLPDLKDELGDLLFQVVFHAEMAREIQAFDFGDVVQAVIGKMIRRHPHVFAGLHLETAEAQRSAWEDLKAGEREGRDDASVLSGVGLALPALTRAEKLGKRAARVGFDWRDAAGVVDKTREELDELSSAVMAGNPLEMEEELGDLLFTLVNLARHLRVDPEAALRSANRKFERRFRALEQRCAAAGRELAGLTPAEWDAAWESVKGGDLPPQGKSPR